MLLRQLIQQPTTSSKLLVCDPFHMPGREELVMEVIGLANADAEGPRHILFGINPAAIDGKKIVGIDEAATADLKKAHRYISELVEPVLSLAFIFDRVDGKLVGALEVDACDEGPFAVGQDHSEELARGKSWIRDGRELREVDIDELARPSEPAPEQASDEALLVDPRAIPPIDVGFNDDPDSKFIELSIPDASDPPIPKENQDAGESRDLGETLRKTLNKTVNTVTTQILRLRKREPDAYDSTDVASAAEDLLSEIEDHYYYEEKALQLNFAVCSQGTQRIGDVCIEIGFPIFKDFDIADRIYKSPFDKRASAVPNSAGYPEVDKRDKAILVRSMVGVLEPNKPVPALKCALRLKVGPAAQRRKLEVLYKLRQGDLNIGQGRLKIKFGKVTA